MAIDKNDPLFCEYRRRDIVERLRSYSSVWEDIEPLCETAAAEIERLRERLHKLEGRCSSAAFLLQAPIEEATDGSR